MVSVRSGVGRRRPVAHCEVPVLAALEHPDASSRRKPPRCGSRSGARTWRCRPKTVEHRRVRRLQPTGHGARLFRSREHLLGERAHVSRYPVVARRLQFTRRPPAHPAPLQAGLRRRADRPFPPNREPAGAARARLLGHLAARQARVRALRLVRSDERANPGRAGSTGPPRRRRPAHSSTSPWSS